MTLSPHPKPNTLSTRDDFVRLGNQLVRALEPRLSPGCARLKIGETGAFYGANGIGLEGYSRGLWLLAPLSESGPRTRSGPGSVATRLFRNWSKGLANGTNPAHPEFWGWPVDCDARLVEMAALAFALRLRPERLWTPLDSAQRTRAAAWLGSINTTRLPDNNWRFFRVLVNEALAHVGAPHDERRARTDLDALEAMDLGNGWFEDGPGGACDHYNGFAFHFYGLLLSVWTADRDPARAGRFRARAQRFAHDYAHWFDTDGAAVPYGRSMIYRFGAAAFWAAAAYARLPVFTPGALRGFVARHLRWWFDRPILDPAGLLTLGYSYPNLNPTEIYNSPASPYWATKTFLVLALPPRDPFWTEPERPLPRLPRSRPQADQRLLPLRCRSGHAILLNAGQNWAWDGRSFGAKYARFAYSSRFGFSVPLDDRSLEACAPDSSLWVSRGGERWTTRGRVISRTAGIDWIESVWRPIPGVEIRTRLEARAPWHLRTHEIRTRFALEVCEGAFAVPVGPEPLESHSLNPVPGVLRVSGPGLAAYGFGALASGLRDLPAAGLEPRDGTLLQPWPNTNLYAPSTVIPVLRAKLAPGTHILRSAVLGDARKGFVRSWSAPPR